MLAAKALPATVPLDPSPDQRYRCEAASALSGDLGHVLAAVELVTEDDTSPRWFDPQALSVAEVLGRHASSALSSARQEESLQQAVGARTLIGQTQGILMERFDLDEESAFGVLRRHSQNTNLKLNEVARILVKSRTLPKY